MILLKESFSTKNNWCMTVNEIYLEIGQAIYDSIEVEDWERAILNIEIQDKYLGTHFVYFLKNNVKKSAKLIKEPNFADSIFELHSITTEGGHNRWNKLAFTLYPDFKFNLDFIWDQEWQDEVDGYNNELKA
jgi:hypothetical protein